ncbi:MAG TPA: DUF885 domain-containing protein [Streptosporangiaceae bacterium]|nr:DUF885 domain-containing protein [Streptosporangiaceae bacterium]
MTAESAIEALAGELAGVLLSGDPFGASFMSIPGYDDAVPDLSPEYQQAWRGRLVGIIARGAGYEADGLGIDHRVLLETARDTAARELVAADSRVYDFSVTTFPLGGPSLVLLTASRTSVTDPASALAYLARCRQIPVYLDQHAARLRAAARDSLAPVAPLVSDAIRQLEHYRSHPERDPMLAHRPPEGWAGAAAWQEHLEGVVRDEIRPAMGRYAGLLAELLPRSRRPEQAGLLYVPGGVAAYASCVRNGTTLPFDPDELHRLGLGVLAEIEEQIAELGRRALGAADAAEIMVRFRKDPEMTAPDGTAAMTRAAAAIARAEDRLPDMFRAPFPPPCAVDPMPPHMAEFGAPPYYSPPARDGSRPGAYLFNDVRPGQAGSWALEATAFHEGVPGHHAQFARVQLLPGLPLLLSGFYIVPHGEGWGLYAERLADEFGLYSDDMQRMGMLGSAAFRAVRLVVDTGLHARGWSRERAREFALAHSPMPEEFVDAEIDRYIALPGQALGYLTGQREILRLRDDARSRLGAAFDICDFHSAVLDHGSLPLPVLRQVVADWTASAAAATT